MAYDDNDLERIAGGGLAASPTANVLIEESILGWKEYELELMRDNRDNVVVVCSIENLDPVGVHTGDSVTVAPPAMTLTDREYQIMRDLSIDILREVGVDTGGCNIQFAQDPRDGRLVVIEMNPRVSRSSALASKATGFPIAKIAAKLAIGYSLDEIVNDITKETPACFEPTLDYVVVKAPRFAFEKFPGADDTLTTTMKSVGEAMSLGRSFAEALGKVMRSLETKAGGFWAEANRPDPKTVDLPALLEEIKTPKDGRLYKLMLAFEPAPRSRTCTRPPPSIRGSWPRSAGSPRWERRSATPTSSTRPCCARRSRPASPTVRSPLSVRISRTRPRCGRIACCSVCARSTRPWTPVRPSSRRRRPTTTRPMSSIPRPPARSRRSRIVQGADPRFGRTASDRASNSTTRVSTPHSR